MLAKTRKEFRIVHANEQIQLHHVACSEQVTLVLAWPQTFPGGMSFETLRKTAENHMSVFHEVQANAESNEEDSE